MRVLDNYNAHKQKIHHKSDKQQRKQIKGYFLEECNNGIPDEGVFSATEYRSG